jgi:hypothetical protein
MRSGTLGFERSSLSSPFLISSLIDLLSYLRLPMPTALFCPNVPVFQSLQSGRVEIREKIDERRDKIEKPRAFPP